MQRLSSSNIRDLMPARRTRGNDKGIRICRQRRRQRKVRNGHADIVMFALKTERPRHAATAGVKQYRLKPRYQPESRGCVIHAAQSLLMAVAVHQALLLSGSER